MHNNNNICQLCCHASYNHYIHNYYNTIAYFCDKTHTHTCTFTVHNNTDIESSQNNNAILCVCVCAENIVG